MPKLNKKYKRCTTCKTILPVNRFYKDSRHKDGLRSECKKCDMVYSKRWNKRNKERYEKWLKDYNKSPKNKNYKNNWRKERRKKDIKFRLDGNIASAISTALKGKKEGRRWEILTGYTLEKLIRHLEKQFTPEMSWDNYGIYWEVDHKILKSWFNYTKPEDEEFKKCWGLNNLRPLERIANRERQRKKLLS